MGLLCLFVWFLNLNGLLWRLQVLLGQGLNRMLDSLLTYTPTSSTAEVLACDITRELHGPLCSFRYHTSKSKKLIPSSYQLL